MIISRCQKADFFSGRFEAVIFDLDGVITDTAAVHAAAWKEMFNAFLSDYEKETGRRLNPFDAAEDYRAYVDGRPRYEGAAAFLKAHEIDLPYGSPEDPPEKQSVCGLGNRKNEIFRKKLEQEGVKVFDGALRLVQRLKSQNVKTAVVSSSKNCKAVLDAAGIRHLFDAVVDGLEAAKLSLKGKPAPDFFGEAAGRLSVNRLRTAVVEDALSGVAAARAGEFGWVVGVDRVGQAAALKQKGADIVVKNLADLESAHERSETRKRDSLPSALENLDGIVQCCECRRVAVFLDYDGTLTPIVRRPEEALLPETARPVLRELAKFCTVAVISGRDLKDVQSKVGIDGFYYAGSHGFDISGPGDRLIEHQAGADFLPAIDQAEKMLHQRLKDMNGVRIERKKFSIAVHYREAAEDAAEDLADAVDAVRNVVSGLRRSSGKKVFELQPDIDWHKGRAVRWLLSELDMDERDVLPVYIGDDVTDEDAFEALDADGITICVTEDPRKETAAHYRLADPDRVHAFLAQLVEMMRRAPGPLDWVLAYDGFDPEEEGLRESLCTLGNGYFCTRGAAPECDADAVHYPGTYLAGGYNRLKTEKAGRIIENEDLVNLPNWLALTFRIDRGRWFRPADADILEYRQELDIYQGVLTRRLRFRDAKGRVTRLSQRRWVHMQRAHLAGLEIILTPENWSGTVEFRTALDGRIVNNGVERYQGLNNRHLIPLETRQPDAESLFLKVQTSQSELRVAVAARTRVFRGGEPLDVSRRNLLESDHAVQVLGVETAPENAVRVEKVSALYTSRDAAVTECGAAACRELGDAGSFSELMRSHTEAWRRLWRSFILEISHGPMNSRDRMGMVVNLYTFHLLQTTSMNTMSMALDAGIPSRGWHGEAYRGHIFWDELFIFPLINLRLPEITKALLMYRYRRLESARTAAREAGYRGAMFPWQSGSSGREESQKIHLNPHSGRWIPDNSRLQRHVNAAIAYNIYQYYQVTEDREFLSFYGAEMMLEIARFWASITCFNEELDRYEILNVMGPDEYHDAYPDSREAGLNNNAYTNVMAVWVLKYARELLEILPEDLRGTLCEKIGMTSEELQKWEDITRKMRIVFHGDGIISQFEGYDSLAEFDWDGYRRKYGDIQRLDRILEAEGGSPNYYKASKQADVLMLFYLLSAEELKAIFNDLGYPFAPDTIPKNIDYYLKRTSHGSTLSRVVHAWVLARSDRARSWEMFLKALESDVADIQGGTTPEGIHLGAMAGTVDQLQRGYTGIVVSGDTLTLNPCLPPQLKRLCIHIRFRGHFLKIEIEPENLYVTTLRTVEKPIQIEFEDGIYDLAAESTLTFSLVQKS